MTTSPDRRTAQERGIKMGNRVIEPAGPRISQLITATGGVGPYVFTKVSGTLPPNLSIAPGGTISGTCTTIGTFTFTIKATDSQGCSGTKTYTITVTN